MSNPEQGTATAAASPEVRIIFEKYTLPNGLEVILSEDHRLPVVAVNLWYHVGPANERPGRTGFAHLFEHMMFQGSKHVGGAPIKALESIGATQINGTTSFDRTNYFETVPSEKLEYALWFESDRMAFLLDGLTARNLENQRDVVRNERRQGENRPYKLAWEELFRQLFPEGHPYRGFIIGSHADIEAVSLNEVREFCKQFYVPNNATLALVGDFESAEAKRLVQKYFGPIPGGKAIPKIAVDGNGIRESKRVTVTDTVELPQVIKAWLTPPIFQAGEAEFDMLAQMLGGGRSSRLYQKLVAEKQIAQEANASNLSLTLASVFTISVTAKPGIAVEEIEASIESELRLLCDAGPTAEEIARARNQVQTNFVLSLQEPGGFAGVADRLNTYNHHLGDPDYAARDFARYDAVTISDIQEVARRLNSETCITVIALPGPKVLDDVPKRTQTESDKLDEVVSLKDSEWRANPPSSTVRVLPSPPIPISFVLDNGLRVLFLEQRHVPAVSAEFISLGGNLENPASVPGLASFTAEMLLRGTKSRSRRQIWEELDLLGASMRIQSRSDWSEFGFEVLTKNVDAAMEVLADVLQNPKFDTEELEKLRHERLTGIAQEKDQPAVVAHKLLMTELYGDGHPYGHLSNGTETSNRLVNCEQLSTLYLNSYTPANAAVILCGYLSEKEAAALVEKHFNAWSTRSARDEVRHHAVNRERRVIIVDRPGAPQTQLLIGQVGISRLYPHFAQTQVMNLIAGGLFSSRINTNLREAHGYTYGARSQFDARRFAGPFTISAAVRTDATAAAVAEIFKEIRELQAADVSDSELAVAKEAASRSVLSRFQTIFGSAAAIGELYGYDLPQNEYRKLLGDISEVCAGDVRQAAKLIIPEQMAVVAVGDAAVIQQQLQELNLGEVSMLKE